MRVKQSSFGGEQKGGGKKLLPFDLKTSNFQNGKEQENQWKRPKITLAKTVRYVNKVIQA